MQKSRIGVNKPTEGRSVNCN